MVEEISFYRADSKNEEDLLKLFNLIKDEHKSFFEAIYPKEICDYLKHFLNEQSLKDKIELDNHIFYFIEKNKTTTGYFEYKCFNDILLICDIFLKQKFRNKKYSNFVFDFLKQEAKKQNLKKFWAYIYQKNNNAKNIFEKWNFKKINTQAKYIGSDIYLFEDVFEYAF